MKSVVALTLALFVTACGSTNTTSQTSDATSPRPEAARSLFALKGQIESVVVKSADAPAMGIWSEVTVSYIVSCAVRFETAALSYSMNEADQIKIFSSAYASAPIERSGQLFCQAFSHETKTISLPGIVSQDSVELVNMTAAAMKIPTGTVGISSASEVRVVSTRPLCAEGRICVYGGTIVELAVRMNSCVNSLGPVAFSVEQNIDNGLMSPVKLAVNVIEFTDESAAYVRCAQTIETTTITLPMIFVGEEPIELTVVK